MDQDKEIKAEEVLVYLNQAACHLKTNNHGAALACSLKALEHDDKNIKGLFRKGQALQGLGDWAAARETFSKAIEIDPKSQELKKALVGVSKLEADHKKKEQALYSRMF